MQHFVMVHFNVTQFSRIQYENAEELQISGGFEGNMRKFKSNHFHLAFSCLIKVEYNAMLKYINCIIILNCR